MTRDKDYYVRAVLLLMMLCLVACAPKTNSKLHTIRMDIEGPTLYDYRIDYGTTVLPFGNHGDPDFGGGYSYMDKMPLPEVAVASWRTAPAPDGATVRFMVPIREQVTEAEWNGFHFALEFHSTTTTLTVNVTNGITNDREHPKTIRQIYSGTATPAGALDP
ncbi:hypothetical protein [Lysobacter panacisoli]|uniref:DUF3304 domain-containing protein n=1 Tax=Lysobacter panacisoli TaxID=1255263 RepID=A0ABP9L6C0_9GAMM|nr:hypothetical protein [Lysobacter panacisoli]